MASPLDLANLPAADIAVAQLFLAAIDPAPAAAFDFRSVDDRGSDPRLSIKAHGTLSRGVRQSSNTGKDGKNCCPASLLAFMQSKGAGVFVAPNAMDGRGQRQENVTCIRTFWADFDSRDAAERLPAFISMTGLTPTILVASGGIDQGVEKQHAYWRVQGCPVTAFREGQLTLVSRCGSDAAVHDAGRVMRLPGFDHLKREPRRTRILEINPVCYGHTEFLARVRAAPQIADPWAGGRGTGQSHRGGRPAGGAPSSTTTARLRALLDLNGGLIVPAARALLREAVAPADGGAGNRHQTLLTIAARCAQRGWPPADIRQLVLPIINAEWADGDWGAHLDRTIVWVWERQAGPRSDIPGVPSRLTSALSSRAGLGARP